MTEPLLTLSIPQLPKLPNTLLGAHWRVRSTHAKKWSQYIWLALSGKFKAEFPLVRARITLTRCSPRQGDFDGLVGSFKPVLDALVKHKVIVDDSPAHVICLYQWEKTAKDSQGIKVEVWQ